MVGYIYILHRYVDYIKEKGTLGIQLDNENYNTLRKLRSLTKV